MSTFFSSLFFGKTKEEGRVGRGESRRAEEVFVEGAEFYVGTHIYIGRDLLRNLSNLEAFTKQCNSFALNPRDHSRPLYRPIHESKEVFSRLREVLKARKYYLDVLAPDSSNTCCCISKWKDAPVTSVVLCNQVLEAFMTVQSSEALVKHLDCESWVSKFISSVSSVAEPTCATHKLGSKHKVPSKVPVPSQIKLISGRYEVSRRPSVSPILVSVCSPTTTTIGPSLLTSLTPPHQTHTHTHTHTHNRWQRE
jgi:hypothetical protein